MRRAPLGASALCLEVFLEELLGLGIALVRCKLSLFALLGELDLGLLGPRGVHREPPLVQLVPLRARPTRLVLLLLRLGREFLLCLLLAFLTRRRHRRRLASSQRIRVLHVRLGALARLALFRLAFEAHLAHRQAIGGLALGKSRLLVGTLEGRCVRTRLVGLPGRRLNVSEPGLELGAQPGSIAPKVVRRRARDSLPNAHHHAHDERPCPRGWRARWRQGLVHRAALCSTRTRCRRIPEGRLQLCDACLLVLALLKAMLECTLDCNRLPGTLFGLLANLLDLAQPLLRLLLAARRLRRPS